MILFDIVTTFEETLYTLCHIPRNQNVNVFDGAIFMCRDYS